MRVRNRLALLALVELVLAPVLATAPAQATPGIAIKEGKACGYCHLNPAGGMPLNYRGSFYAWHGQSFAGFDDAAAAVPPQLVLSWQQVLSDQPTRIAVDDTTGRGKPSLIVVSPSGAGRKISIQSWDPAAAKLVEDAVINAAEGADRLETGHFNTDRAHVIVLPDGYIHFENNAYTFHKGQGADSIVGAARSRSGKELFYTFNGKTAVAHQVSTDPDDESWLTAAPRDFAPFADGSWWTEARGENASALAKLWGVSTNANGAALLGVWDPLGSGRWYTAAPLSGANGAAGEFVALFPAGPAAAASATPVWTSPPLTGKVIDVAEGTDIRKHNMQPGLYVLAQSGSGTDRTLYYFSLQ